MEDLMFKISPQAIARGIEDLLDENERLNNIINGLNNTIENLEEVVEHKDNIINELEKWLNHSIERINEKLIEDKKEIKFENGICKNMNDYQILRLRTFRIKMKEVLDKLKELKESNNE